LGAGNSSQEEDVKIIEAEPVIVPAAGNDYVDSAQSLLYGSHTSVIPGMGDSNTTTTDLTESSYSAWNNLLTQATFSSTPPGWSAYDILYSSGDFQNDPESYGGSMTCPDIDTSAYTQVRFILNIGVTSMPHKVFTVRIWFYNDQGTWDLMGIVPDREQSDITYSSSDSKYLHSNFKVKVDYASEYWAGAFTADNWRVDGYQGVGHRFEAVYKFTGVDWNTYAKEELVVNFAISSSPEDLTFKFEAGDTTPDHTIQSSVHSDFTVDIHSYLTGSECYVSISDVYRNGDSDQDTWRIQEMYIRLTDTAPVNDQTPSCSNLDDGNMLYARNRYYEISTSHQDGDGASHIESVELSCLNDARTITYWTLKYEAGVGFTESSDPNNYVTLDGSGSESTTSGVNLDLVFHLMIDWNHPIASGIDLRCVVTDDESASASNYYETGWDIESRLDIPSFSLDDGAGTDDRGNTNGQIVASGTVKYLGGTVHPPTTEVDVYVICTEVASSPWETTNYESTGGSFSVNVQADDEVGLDTYTVKAVAEGTGAGGASLLFSSVTDTYIADEIVCWDLHSPQFIVDSQATGFMVAALEYAYDSTYVTNGSYLLGDRQLTYHGTNSWQASNAPGTAVHIVYDSIVLSAANTHGISVINMNGHSLDMYWEELVCYIDGPDSPTVNIGENATGIHMWAEYSFYSLHGHRYYDGTLHLNNTNFSYDTIGTRGYMVASADGDDSWSVSTIASTQSTSCTWVYPDPPPSWNTVPEDQLAEWGFHFNYSLDASVPSGVSLWWLNDTVHFLISQSGVVENATILDRTVYGLQVWVNDTYGRSITAEFSVTVQETTGPSWEEIPVDQYSEFAQPFQYALVANAMMGLDCWWLNDTTWLTIDQFGVVTNATFLPVGTYPVEVSVNDTWGRVLTGVFSVIVQDTTGPTFTDVPTTLTVEFGGALDANLSAWDISGVSHWTINDTANFAILSTGQFFNLTIAGPGTYGILVTVYDVYMNTRSTTFTVIVLPAEGPEWVEEPVDQVVELGHTFTIDLDAVDFSGIGSWALDGPEYFTIDQNGTVEASGSVPVGSYTLVVSVTDSLGNVATATFVVTVVDTTAPVWVTTPADVNLTYGEVIGIQLSATDLSGIAQWTVISLTDFEINGSGYVTYNGVLAPGVYILNVTAIDPYGNAVSAVFTIEVAEAQGVLGLPPSLLVTIVLGTVGIVVLLVLGRNTILSKIRGGSGHMLKTAVVRLVLSEGGV